MYSRNTEPRLRRTGRSPGIRVDAAAQSHLRNGMTTLRPDSGVCAWPRALHPCQTATRSPLPNPGTGIQEKRMGQTDNFITVLSARHGRALITDSAQWHFFGMDPYTVGGVVVVDALPLSFN